MFNIVDYFEELIETWNQDFQCGFCWRFVFARKDYSNLKKLTKEDKCCVHFLLEKKKTKAVKRVNEEMGISHTLYCETKFEAFIGVASDFTIQYHNELGFDKSEGKYERYVKKIEECINCEFEIDLCKLITDGISPTYFTEYEYEPKINYKDINFDGIFFRGTIRTDYL